MKTKFSLFLSLVFLAPAPLAWSQGNPLRQELTHLSTQQQQMEIELQGLRQTFVERANEIETIRKQGREKTNPLLDLKLQRMMKEAHGLSVTLRQVETKKLELTRQIRSTYQKAIELIDQNIELTAQQLKQPKIPSALKRQLTQEFNLLLTERDQLHERYQPTLLLPDQLPLTPHEGEPLESLEAKAAVLGDFRDRLVQNLTHVQGRLAQMQRQKVLLNEAHRFLDEESFFAETSFAKHASGANVELSKGVDAKTAGSGNAESATGGNQNAPLNSAETGAPALPDLQATLESPQTLNPIRRIQLDAFVLRRGKDGNTLGSALSQLKDSESRLKEQLAQVQNALELVESMIRLSAHPSPRI